MKSIYNFHCILKSCCSGHLKVHDVILISTFSYMCKYQIIETSANDKTFGAEVFLTKELNGTSNKNWWDKCLEPSCVRGLTEIAFRCLGNSCPFRVCANFWVVKWLFFSQAQ